jgi:hypothetical protein
MEAHPGVLRLMASPIHSLWEVRVVLRAGRYKLRRQSTEGGEYHSVLRSHGALEFPK